MKTLTIAAGFAMIASSALAETPVLTVYTYDSFVSDWGPGPAVEKAFEANCGCDLQFVAVGDGAELLSRLRLEGARTKADVALGLDTNLIPAASETGLFAPAQIETSALDLPIAWKDDTFLPFDWGWFAFVYDKTKVPNPPRSFDDIVASDYSIVIEDPRSSTPGLGLLLWVKSIYGDKAPQIWAGLNKHVVTVTKGWSEAYGMFLDGEADMVLSYTTSPAYHRLAEGDDSKGAAVFDDGNYMQIEVAAKLASSKHQKLADAFLQFMLSDAFQSAIPETNWMYPAVTPKGGLPDGFETQPRPEKSLIYLGDEAQQKRDEALAEWLTVSAH